MFIIYWIVKVILLIWVVHLLFLPIAFILSIFARLGDGVLNAMTLGLNYGQKPKKKENKIARDNTQIRHR